MPAVAPTKNGICTQLAHRIEPMQRTCLAGRGTQAAAEAATRTYMPLLQVECA